MKQNALLAGWFAFAVAFAACRAARSTEGDAGAADAGPAVKKLNVEYKRIGMTRLRMYGALPESPAPEGGRAAIIFFFAGGWAEGSPKQFEQQCIHYAGRGMAAFAPDYRVYRRQRTLPFRAVSDAKSAVRWVRSRAAEYGINPDMIVAAGGSAGGHLAACTAMIDDFEDAGEDLTVSSRPNALVLFNPAVDTSPMEGAAGPRLMAAATAISPVDHVRKGLPPTIVFHGKADQTVPFENAERFCGLMKDAGNDCELFAYEGAGHGFHNHSSFRKKAGAADNRYYYDTLGKTDAFLERLGYLQKTAAGPGGEKSP